ncbi:type VII secretion protein EsaA [Enterococcus crotali]
MNSKKLYYLLKSVWMVVILLIMLIFMNRDFTDISANKAKEEQDMRLNIALVNEDNGIEKNNIDYNLGSDYVKKIEKDATYNWFTVSRGIAENGLKNGTYNLLVTIPSNFSSKLLELDSEAPEKVQVNYKINANGNATLENESRSVGRKIVNDLNQQLVDLYVVSIVDNLYTAQRNIEKVYTNQTDSVGKFQDILYQPTINFKEYLPSITSQSKNALETNNLLTDTLTNYTKSTESLVSSHGDQSTTVEELLKQRADGKITYEEFLAILVSMDESILSSETDELYRTIKSVNDAMQNDFGAVGADGEYVQKTKELQEQLAASQEEVNAQLENLKQINLNYFKTYKEYFYSYFGYRNLEEDDYPEIRLSDALKKKGNEHLASVKNIETFNKNHLKTMQKRLGSLPYTGISLNLDPIYTYPRVPYGDQQPLDQIITMQTGISEKVDAINETINEINQRNQYPEGQEIKTLNFVDEPTNGYYRDLKYAYDRLENEWERLPRRGEFTLSFTEMEEGQLAVAIPEYVEVTSIYGVKDGGRFDPPLQVGTYTFNLTKYQREITISYNIKEDYDETTVVSPQFDLQISKVMNISRMLPATTTTKIIKEETADEEKQETTESSTPEKREADETDVPLVPTEPETSTGSAVSVTFPYKVDVSGFLNQDYQEAKRKYSEEVGKVLELYKSVDAELEEFQDYPFEEFHDLLSMPLTDVLQGLINETFDRGHYRTQSEELIDLQRKATDMEKQAEDASTRLGKIQENSLTLNETVAGQLAKMEDWRKTSQEMTAGEKLVDSTNKETDSRIEALKASLDALNEQTKMVKDASETNVKEASDVRNVFDSFDKEVQTAQKNGEDLSANADVIMDNLNKELANNNDFVSAFIKVLNNAHKDGVPNNTLLQFIANPVNGKSEATIKTTEINEPFTWILIMYTLSLFIAYLFATQPVARKVKNKFKREKLWLKDNMLETLLLSLSAIGIGLILGILSISELGIVKESQIVWVMMIVLFMLIFSLLNHYALKQFHIAGFALSLFLFISYVFVTNAIGKTKGNNPMVDLIRSVNPLSIGENNLADILANNALNIVQIILYLLAIAALIVFNIFIWKPKRKAKEVTPK